jgi:hypothetical protein
MPFPGEPLRTATVASGLSTAALARLLASCPVRISALSAKAHIAASPRPTRLTERQLSEIYAAVRAAFDQEAGRVARVLRRAA